MGVSSIDHEVGSIEVGKEADLILIDLNRAHLQPVHNLEALLAYSVTGADVIVNGKVLMRHRELLTIDIEEVFRQVSSRASRLVEKL